MLFRDWAELRHILFVGSASYLLLVLFLRVSGKRTLSKLNAFDLVVTVALGSTLAASLTQQSLSIAGTALSFGLLIGFQFLITWLSVRSRAFARIVKSRPTVLYYRGVFFESVLKRQRVTRNEIFSALRAQGIASLSDVEAVVMESNAEIVCLRKWIQRRPDALPDGDSTLPGQDLSA